MAHIDSIRLNQGKANSIDLYQKYTCFGNCMWCTSNGLQKLWLSINNSANLHRRDNYNDNNVDWNIGNIYDGNKVKSNKWLYLE